MHGAPRGLFGLALLLACSSRGGGSVGASSSEDESGAAPPAEVEIAPIYIGGTQIGALCGGALPIDDDNIRFWLGGGVSDLSGEHAAGVGVRLPTGAPDGEINARDAFDIETSNSRIHDCDFNVEAWAGAVCGATWRPDGSHAFVGFVERDGSGIRYLWEGESGPYAPEYSRCTSISMDADGLTYAAFEDAFGNSKLLGFDASWNQTSVPGYLPPLLGGQPTAAHIGFRGGAHSDSSFMRVVGYLKGPEEGAVAGYWKADSSYSIFAGYAWGHVALPPAGWASAMLENVVELPHTEAKRYFIGRLAEEKLAPDSAGWSAHVLETPQTWIPLGNVERVFAVHAHHNGFLFGGVSSSVESEALLGYWEPNEDARILWRGTNLGVSSIVAFAEMDERLFVCGNHGGVGTWLGSPKVWCGEVLGL